MSQAWPKSGSTGTRRGPTNQFLRKHSVFLSGNLSYCGKRKASRLSILMQMRWCSPAVACVSPSPTYFRLEQENTHINLKEVGTLKVFLLLGVGRGKPRRTSCSWDPHGALYPSDPALGATLLSNIQSTHLNDKGTFRNDAHLRKRFLSVPPPTSPPPARTSIVNKIYKKKL